jgi:hypothetical protein
MRLLVLATATALGVGLLGTSGASAAPANGVIIDQSAAVLDQAVVQEVGHSRWRSARRGMRERWERFRHRDRDHDRDRGRDRDRR